jgi:hypothetical protein
MSIDRVSVGEGFAFFRWHCLSFSSESNCRGVAEWERFPLCVCRTDWECLKHGH